MKALILTGGSGRDFVPFSATRPKAMTVLTGAPLLDRTLTHLREAGVTTVTIVVGTGGDILRRSFGNGDAAGVHITYVEQGGRRGIANAVLAARDRFMPGEHFLLVYGDVVTAANPFPQLVQAFNALTNPVACVCLPGPPTARYGNVYMSGTKITRIVEKPSKSGLGNYVLAGAFVLPTEVFEIVQKSGGDMEAVFAGLIEGPGLNASIWEEGWIDLEHPWDILAANRMVMETWEEASISRHATIDANVTISGPVHIERGSVIRAGAVLSGPCYIGRDCYVGNNALVREHSSLGPGSRVGYGVELKNCVLFGGCEIGRLSFVGDSVIGESVDLGSGTVTINENIDRSNVCVEVRKRKVDCGLNKLGAFIGDGVKVGAGNTLAAGTVLNPNTTVPHHATVGTAK
jgi:bifunctional UDP-N-acetylglucosamine pyrophosphorylase/glucosamine-1-phosphate N-acetyltransferase